MWQCGIHSGVSAVLEGGRVIERGAVNTTFIKDLPLPASRAESLAAQGLGVAPGDRYGNWILQRLWSD